MPEQRFSCSWPSNLSFSIFRFGAERIKKPFGRRVSSDTTNEGRSQDSHRFREHSLPLSFSRDYGFLTSTDHKSSPTSIEKLSPEQIVQKPKRSTFLTSIKTCACCGSKVALQRDLSNMQCPICATIIEHKTSSTECHETVSFLDRRQLFRIHDRCLTVRKMMGESAHHNDWAPLISELVALFSSAKAMNAFFVFDNHDDAVSAKHDADIDLYKAKEIFDLIVSLPLEVSTFCLEACERTCKHPDVQINSAKSIRYLLVMFELVCEFRSQKIQESLDNRSLKSLQSIEKRLLGFISNLSNDLHHFFVKWLSSPYYQDVELFSQRVERVNDFLSRKLWRKACFQRIEYTAYENNWQIRAAVKTLALFWASNQQSRRLHIANFYNSIIDYIDLYSDYDNWVRRKSRLNFCQYPFILPVSAKLAILELESKRQMELKAREAFFSTTRIDPFLLVKVRREYLVEDSINQLQSHFRELKKSLKICFDGEDGVDAGGLRKEWFSLLFKELFNPQEGLFCLEDGSDVHWFDSKCCNTELFFTVGTIVGLAIYNSTMINVPLPSACFKKLFGVPPNMDDLKEINPQIAKGLCEILNFEGDDFESTYNLYFSVMHHQVSSNGHVKYNQVNLISRGSKTPVTKENRMRYVQKMLSWYLNESVQKQFECFKRGFLQVCGSNALSLFRPEEIEHLIRERVNDIDVAALRAISSSETYDPEVNAHNEKVIEWFWALFDSASIEVKKRILFFVTGCERMPYMSVSSLPGLRISVMGPDCARLPIAHTCFNQLCLYRYESQEKLNLLLLRALFDSHGYELQ